jgi:hypothetical protein
LIPSWASGPAHHLTKSAGLAAGSGVACHPNFIFRDMILA